GVVVITSIFYILSHSTTELMSLAETFAKDSFYIWIIKIIYYVFPNLDYYSMVDKIIYSKPITLGNIAVGWLQAILYTAILVVMGAIDLKKKDL
ncbi:MAG: hypothetical protein GXO45_04020, partial [Aquificae bacterium]|nr:hypothetical protein [Aquificota bacterium]